MYFFCDATALALIIDDFAKLFNVHSDGMVSASIASHGNFTI